MGEGSATACKPQADGPTAPHPKSGARRAAPPSHSIPINSTSNTNTEPAGIAPCARLP